VSIRSGTDHWGSLAKFFHWTTVVLILVQGAIGLTMVALPKQPSVIPIYTFHKSLGLTILAFATLRLAWRVFDPRPDEPASVPRWQAIGARIGHAVLYALIFLVPLSGWWYDSVAALRPLYWFGLVPIPPLGGPDPTQPNLKFIARERHEFLFWTLMVVAAGHVLMALIHHFRDRDEVLRRMLPAFLTRR
jgi:cytochrome b561